MDASTLSPNVVKQAIHWMLRLRESGQNPGLLLQCEQWRNAHHDHELAWQRVTDLHHELNLRAIPGVSVVLQTLETSQRRLHRRQALKLFSGVALTGSAAWLGKDLQVLSGWTSDFTTGTGERRTFPLPDGSQLQLNTRSAVDLAFDERQRLVRLRQGELMLTCNTQQAQDRPLLVQTRDALLEGFEGRLVVRQDTDCTRVSVSTGKVAVHRFAGRPLQWLTAGQTWRLDHHGARLIEHPALDASAWAEDLIVTRDMRLADFLAEVARYRHGHLSCSDDVADLRLCGVFRLEDTDKLLELLPQTLPITLRLRTRWWIRVERLT